jgi:thiol:disulfide interchange protein DsbD
LVNRLALGFFVLAVGCASSAPPTGIVDVPPPPSADPSQASDAPLARATASWGRGQWLTDEAAGHEVAKAQRAPLLVDFRASWCTACLELERTSYPDPAVAAELGRFVLVRIDATNDEDPAVKALIARYGVVGLPTLVLFDGTGREVKRVDDFVPPEKLASILHAIR